MYRGEGRQGQKTRSASSKRERESSVGNAPFLRSSQRRRAILNSESNILDFLPEDIIHYIFCRLASTASCITDLINASITCRKFNELAFNSLVLSKASPKCFAVRAKTWSDSAHRFLKLFADAGNVDATYMLGMICFYCLNDLKGGRSLIYDAAKEMYAPAVYTLALIYLNGSGGVRSKQTLTVGVGLCARAARLGHLDALREFGHCVSDGYGVPQNQGKGCRILYKANARLLATINARENTRGEDGSVPEPHQANLFVLEWYGEGGPGVVGRGLKRCSNMECGLPETKKNEFRKCSFCGKVNYCSRTCQRVHWKARHKMDCSHDPLWINALAADNNDDGL